MKVDESPSKLSEKLSGGSGDRVRDVGLGLFEEYLDKTRDFTPIFYLIDKYLSDPTARQEEAIAKIAEFVTTFPGLLAAAGLATTGKRR